MVRRNDPNFYPCMEILNETDPNFAVAMTRPRRHLCVVGDSDTVSRYALDPSSF